MTVIRPADANETREAWKVAVSHKDGPVALVLTRQGLPVIDPGEYRNIAKDLDKGGYALYETSTGGKPDVILTATGSEVHLTLEAAKKLEKEDLNIRVVSLPSWNLFNKQDDSYRKKLFPKNVPIVAVEAGASLGWKPYVGDAITTISVDRYGASAPGETVMKKYGFTVNNICDKVHSVLSKAS
jgi:transketolase